MDSQLDSVPDSKAKAPVVRGARACTVCRAAKMKCVGAEDGQRQCQRCKRANTECVFEKHKRGRKPGSKLSEASKMLRRLEKGLNSAKMKSHPSDSSSPFQTDELRTSPQHAISYSTLQPPSHPSYPAAPSSTFSSPEQVPSQPPHSYPAYHSPIAYSPSGSGPRSALQADEDEDDQERNDEAFIPAKLIKRESQRNSFFRTILNPEETPATTTILVPHRSTSFTPPQISSPISVDLNDPVTAGIISDIDAKTLFDAFFLRLNPFINLFDPALHTVHYVRSKCPFLFTILIMVGAKFFKTDRYRACQKLANAFANRAFAEDRKSVEIVQAYACMTYWKEPDDTRTWTFIGLACRMAVDLRLNRYMRNPPPHETELQRLERRNRERTFLVLFVHDRALSMQCNKQWMLPECELIRNAEHWHEKMGSGPIRPEDVIVTAFVSLRRIAAETEEIFHASKHASGNSNADINYELVLSNCNNRLTQWDTHWQEEIKKASNGETFHHYFLIFFRLYVRIFLNSFAIQGSMPFGSTRAPNLYALSACTSSALECLRIASEEFREIHMLRYGQDAIATMTAYAALTLLKLLRDRHARDHMAPVNPRQIHTLISSSASAYQDASSSPHSPVTISATYHSRFLRNLVLEDVRIYGDPEKDDEHMELDRRSESPPPPRHSSSQYSSQSHHGSSSSGPPFHYQAPTTPVLCHANTSNYQHESQTGTGIVAGSPAQVIHYPNNYVPMPRHASELDAHYWKNMFIQLGFGESAEVSMSSFAAAQGIPSFAEQAPQPHQHPNSAYHHYHHHHHHMQTQGPIHYHSLATPSETFGR